MKKSLVLFFIVLLFNYFFICYIFPVCFDEIWCYGFAYNISNGMIPYLDFNMIVTPLYSFLASIFLTLFGKNLFVMGFFNSIILGCIFIVMYHQIGYKAVFIYFILLWTSFLPGYNYFCLLLVLILMFLDDREDDKYCLYSSLLVSFVFLTKQTVGLCLMISLLYYNKNRFKSIIIFLIPILIFGVYLIYNEAFFAFIDYCFGGMFDFASKNHSVGLISVLELFVIIISLFWFIRSKFKDRFIFLVLMFFIMFFPDTKDVHHFVVGVVPFLVYLFLKLEIRSDWLLKRVCFIFVFFMIVFGLLPYYFEFQTNRDSLEYQVFQDVLDSYEYDHLFVLSMHAYKFKLDNHILINKFDLINNGNMGYHGVDKYIQEIKKTCLKDKCLFLLGADELERNDCGQTNLEILDYVYDNYNCSSEKELLFYVCTN